MVLSAGATSKFVAAASAGVARDLEPGALLGGSVEAVVAGRREHTDEPGLVVFALAARGVTITPFALDELPLVYWPRAAHEDGPAATPQPQDLARLAAAAGLDARRRATFLLVDPFSVRLPAILAGMDAAIRAAGPRPSPGNSGHGPILGGVLSGSSRPRGNTLLLNDRVLHEGLVGVSLSGPIRVDPVVSQGCRPIGPNFIVTAAREGALCRLGGLSALDALGQAVESLSDADRGLLSRGVFVGVVADEYRERFGRGDYLIRGVLGVRKDAGEIAVNDDIRVGQTVRFHVRDPRAASADLDMLLDAHRLSAPPAGALLFTCNGRGRRMFAGSDHDAAAIAALFDKGTPGDQLARAGHAIDPSRLPPLAGFFAAGEIGPVLGRTSTHGFTACAALIREPDEPAPAAPPAGKPA
ncbi:MAG: FIST N-terminal domain-containing protein [Phycisphaerales bacterium]